MMLCCKTKTTPFCGTCGADLEAKSLAGLRKHLGARLESAKKRLDEWMNNGRADREKVMQGIARSTDAIIQLDSWITQLDELTAKEATS